MTKLPDTINVLGSIFKIKQTTLLDNEESQSYGEWDGSDFSIYLEISSPPAHKAITVLHECLHGLDELTHMRLSHQNVYILSQALFQIIIQNPELIKYIADSPMLEEEWNRSRTRHYNKSENGENN
tara:strand:- start:415 stop:792 length:378 start_codon:yes stop_codon:yes gene_type:complete